MEEGAADTPEAAHARERFRVRMLKMSRNIERQQDPTTAVDMSNVPPHLAHRYQ